MTTAAVLDLFADLSAAGLGHRAGYRFVQIGDGDDLGAFGGGETDGVVVARLPRSGDADPQAYGELQIVSTVAVMIPPVAS